MKKGAILTILLMIFMVYCSYKMPSIIGKSVSYKIVKSGNLNYIEGIFWSKRDFKKLLNIFVDLNITKKRFIKRDLAIKGEDSLDLLSSIAPLFISHFKEGKIEFKDMIFKISGVTSNQEVKYKIKKRVEGGGFLLEENIKVIKPKEIEFLIIKEKNLYRVSGIFKSQKELKEIQNVIGAKRYQFEIINFDKDRVFNYKVLQFLRSISHLLNNKDCECQLIYKNGKLKIEGIAKSEEILDKLNIAATAASINLENKITLIKEKKKDNSEDIEGKEITKILAKDINELKRDVSILKKAEQKELLKDKISSNNVTSVKLDIPKVDKNKKLKSANKDKNLSLKKKENKIKNIKRDKNSTKRKDPVTNNKKRASKVKKNTLNNLPKKREKDIKLIKSRLEQLRITFNKNSSSLTKDGKKAIDKLANILKKNRVKVAIGVYIATKVKPKNLLKNRVLKIKNELLKRGVKSSQFRIFSVYQKSKNSKGWVWISVIGGGK